MRVALGALAVAVLAHGVDARRARFASSRLPNTPPTTLASLETIDARAGAPPTDIQAAVENDLFCAGSQRADRRRIECRARRSRMTSQRVEPMKPIVLGTAVATDGRSFATVQLGDGRPTLVHVGDKIGEWVVKAIERGKIVLVSTERLARRRHRAQARNLICRLFVEFSSSALRCRDRRAAGCRATRRQRARRRGQPPTRRERSAEAGHDEEDAAGVSLDFQDQDLQVVLDALAAAGDLNVSLTNIPSQRVTLHMGQPVTREAMIEL